MAKTRRIRKARARKTRARRGGGESCYNTGKTGMITKTWSCTAACGKNGACEAID
jgi:hypothetical protein